MNANLKYIALKESMFGYGDDGSKFICFRWIRGIFEPSIRAKALMSDGKILLYIDNESVGEAAPDQKNKYDVKAVVLGSENVLEATLNLPKIDDVSISGAVALYVQSVSPFLMENTAYAWELETSRVSPCTVSVVIVAKNTIADLLSRVEGGGEHELWYVNKDGVVYRFGGYGEGRRTSIFNRYLALGVFLFMGIMLALAVLLITPTAQMRLRAIEAFHQYQALVDSTKSHVQKKTELLSSADMAKNISGVLSNKTDMQKLLIFLTDVLPDDTHVLNLEVHDLRVKISGSTGNSNNLIKLLGDRPEVKNLRAPVPVTRQPGSSQEGFTLEFSVEPDLLSKLPVVVSSTEPVERSGIAK